jgi:prepilin-type N-terminal cleavage/methylation domain-containing protein
MTRSNRPCPRAEAVGHWSCARRLGGKFRATAVAMRNRGEEGFTLIEMTLTVTIMAVVFAMTTPVVMMYFDLNGDVQTTYSAVNQVILASEEITQYMHEAVAPCPSGTTATGCSTVPFGASTQSSLTFYANTNNANGPSEVVIAISGTTMTVKIYAATASTCPFNGSTTTACTYTGSPHLLTTVSNLSNLTPFTYLPANAAGSTCDGSNASNTPPSVQCADSTANPIAAVYITLQLATIGKSQPNGYQTLAYALAPSYNGTVG